MSSQGFVLADLGAGRTVIGMKGRRDPIATSPLERARGLRRSAATAERTAWRLLRNRRMLGLKFRRQHAIGRFVVDFYCAELRLVLEIDGPVHDGIVKAQYDAARTCWLEGRDLRVVRLRPEDVSEAHLTRLLQNFPFPSSPLSAWRRGGQGVRSERRGERGVRG